MAEVEVQLDPNGTITEARLTKTSGAAAWDGAVMDALKRTRRLPLDFNGRVPRKLVIAFRPR